MLFSPDDESMFYGTWDLASFVFYDLGPFPHLQSEDGVISWVWLW